MKSLRITIYVAPRSTQSGARFGRGRFYSDKGKKLYYDQIRNETLHLLPDKPIQGPVEIEFLFVMKFDGETPASEKPYWGYSRSLANLDNLMKGTQDGLERAGFFRNDAQIWKCRRLESVYESEGSPPRIEVTLHYEEEYQTNKKGSRSKGKKGIPV